MDFATPGYCTWKSYLQSELDMPGEFVESKIKYYKMRREVYAKGGSGEIHIGVDPVTKALVAIKRGFSKERAQYGINIALIREICMLKELSVFKHPNIVTLIDIFPHEGDVYLVEPFYPSYIQQYLVNSDTPFNQEQIKFIMFSAAKALLFLKQHSIIHGDIKPANLLVSNSNSICLTDFGSAHYCDDGKSYVCTNSCISTIYFNAPEILLGSHHITYAADMWSFALTWLRLLGIQITSNFSTQIEMCNAIFQFLGENPKVEDWPEIESIRLFPQVKYENESTLFDRLRQRIPSDLITNEGLELLCSLLKLKAENRASIEDVCNHAYFRNSIYDDVLHGKYVNKEYFPKLTELKKNVIVPPKVNEYFINHMDLDGSTLIEEDCDNDVLDVEPKVLRFENDSCLCSPIKNDRCTMNSSLLSCDQNSLNL